MASISDEGRRAALAAGVAAEARLRPAPRYDPALNKAQKDGNARYRLREWATQEVARILPGVTIHHNDWQAVDVSRFEVTGWVEIAGVKIHARADRGLRSEGFSAGKLTVYISGPGSLPLSQESFGMALARLDGE